MFVLVVTAIYYTKYIIQHRMTTFQHKLKLEYQPTVQHLCSKNVLFLFARYRYLREFRICFYRIRKGFFLSIFFSSTVTGK